MAGLRGAAWSLLPLAAYLTGSIAMFWKIGTAIGTFATSFVFSLKVWSGVGVAALAARAVRGVRRRPPPEAGPRQAGRRGAAGPGGPGRTAGPARPGPSRTGRKVPARKELVTKPTRAGKGVPDDDDDMAGVEDILRRHGIT